MDAPAHFIDPKFSSLRKFFRESIIAQGCTGGSEATVLTYEFLVHIQRHIRIQIFLVVVLPKV